MNISNLTCRPITDACHRNTWPHYDVLMFSRKQKVSCCWPQSVHYRCSYWPHALHTYIEEFFRFNDIGGELRAASQPHVIGLGTVRKDSTVRLPVEEMSSSASAAVGRNSS